MHSDKTETYHLRVKTEGINEILDWFGTNTEFVNESETEDIVESAPIFYDLWVGRYAKHIIEQED